MKGRSPEHAIAYRIRERLFQSGAARHTISLIHRARFAAEKPVVEQWRRTRNDRPLIAINAHEVYQFEHIRPLFRRLRHDPDLRVILIASNPAKIRRPDYQAFMRRNDLRVNRDIFSYIWLPTLRPDIFLETAISSYHRLCGPETIRVLLAHGLASLGFSKNHAHIRHAGGYDFIIATGPLQQKTLHLAARRFNATLPEILAGGFIRGDQLVEKRAGFDRTGLLIRCGLPDRYTIVFAPTWGEFSATTRWLDPIVKLSNDLACNLLIKLHPLMLKGKTRWETAGVDWQERLDRLAQYENIHICDRFSLEEYMLSADIMLTDASSVGLEFMFLQKPVFFLPAPDFFEIFGRDKPVYWVRQGLEVENIAELREKIIALRRDGGAGAEYDLSRIACNPGRATESIATQLMKIIRDRQHRPRNQSHRPGGAAGA